MNDSKPKAETLADGKKRTEKPRKTRQGKKKKPHRRNSPGRKPTTCNNKNCPNSVNGKQQTCSKACKAHIYNYPGDRRRETVYGGKRYQKDGRVVDIETGKTVGWTGIDNKNKPVE